MYGNISRGYEITDDGTVCTKRQLLYFFGRIFEVSVPLDFIFWDYEICVYDFCLL